MQIKKSFLIRAMLIFLIKPVGFIVALGLTNVFRQITIIFTVVAGLSLLISSIKIGKYRRINRKSPGISLFFFFGSLVISTLINNEKVAPLLYFICNNIAILCWLKICYEHDREETLGFLAYYYTFFTVLNDIFVVLAPNGIAEIVANNGFTHHYHVWGIDNTFALYLIPGLCISLYYFVICKNKTWRTEVLLVVIYLFSAIYLQTMATTVCLTIIALIVFLKRVIEIKIASLKYALLVALFIVMYLIYFEGETLLPALIENVLHKSTTFSGRTILWSQATEMIKGSPWLGYGFQESEELFAFNKYSGLYSSHSFYLQLLIYGGILTVICFVTTIISGIRFASRFLGRHFEYLILGLLGVLLYFVFEFNATIYCVFLLIELLYFEALDIAKGNRCY